jgi:hypothetical protein
LIDLCNNCRVRCKSREMGEQERGGNEGVKTIDEMHIDTPD